MDRDEKEGNTSKPWFVCVVCAAQTSQRCKRCATTAYCSVDCQTKHWPEHKKKCKRPTMQFTTPVRNATRGVIHYKKPHPKDVNGKLMALGEKKLAKLQEAMRAPDQSETKKQLWSEYKRMCREEIAAWNQLDEPAGVAKVWYMLAVGCLELGHAEKLDKYIAKTRQVLSTMPDDTETKELHLMTNLVETQAKTVFDTHAYDLKCIVNALDEDALSPDQIARTAKECAKTMTKGNCGQTVDYLRQMQGAAFAFCVVVLLPADKNPHMIPSELHDQFIECALRAHQVHQAKNPYLDRQIFQYVNNTADANNIKTSKEKMGHMVRIFKFDFDSRFSMQRDMPGTLERFYRVLVRV
jgi:hypothetical protein